MRMRVSLCMIARNEAHTLPTCVTSVVDLVDEIIVVDTGSVDETREVAGQLGAKVHHFAWVDDFAAARNESIRQATGDWILWLDGDEHIDADNRIQLRALLDEIKDDNAAYLMKQRSALYSADGEAVLFEQCRLFRNLPAIRWQYRVHEQIHPAVERSGGTVRPTGVYIEHTGYQDATIYRCKLERNLRLLLLEDGERPDDPFTLMNLGWVYQELGQSAAALTYYHRSLGRCDARQPIALKLQALLARAHLALGQRPQALAACQAGRAFCPDDVELSFLEAVLLSELGNLPAAEDLLLRLLQDRPADQPAIGAHPGMRGHMARHNLARVYRAQGRNAEAEVQWRAALAQRPDSVRSLFELGLLWLEQGRTKETEGNVEQLDALGPIGKLAGTMLRAQARLEQGEVAVARRLLEAAVAAGPPALEPRVMLSRLLLKDGTNCEATEQALRSVLALDPNHAEARSQLSTLLNMRRKYSMRVSLCLIARNETANLPACLGAVADLVDEMIVVDTGSTDETRDVARRLGARLYDFVWNDDFAAARNESLRHATGDWIFWLDADERLDEGNRQKLRNLFANLQDENSSFVMKQRSVIDSAGGEASVFEQARLFRNRPDIRWCYRVHEQILPALERSGSLPRFTDIVIDHLGYADPAQHRRKQQRNLELLQRQDAEQPNDSLTQFNLGLTLLALGRKTEALVHCRRSLELAPPNGSWVRKLYDLLASGTAESAEALGELMLSQHRWQELERIVRQLEGLPHGAAAAARLRALCSDNRAESVSYSTFTVFAGAAKLPMPFSEQRAFVQQQGASTMTGDAQPYDRAFFLNNHRGAYRSAKEIVPHVLELLQPQCVVDVGCGIGSWLAVFREHGVTDVLGLDGAHVDLNLLQIPHEQFLAHDLTQPLQLSRHFDLALSLEVAEHLPADGAAAFVTSLVGLAPVVLFSAAVPYQGGTHHVNEQWPGYWISLFERHGYVVLDCLRDKVWGNNRVDWWYCQNLLLFCTPDVLQRNAGLRRELASTPRAPLALVHPRLFLQAIGVILDLRRQLAGREEK
jgi:glycosyltransferase involved in cell wall biosynthesis/SAM-dependent methyltransferase